MDIKLMNMRNRKQKLSGKPPQRHSIVPLLKLLISFTSVFEFSGFKASLYNLKDALLSDNQ